MFLEFPLSCNYRNGFTLIEMIIITAAIILLVILAVPRYHNYQNLNDIEHAVEDISEINKAVTRYQLENNKLPKSLSVLDIMNMQDPWGKPYQYVIHKDTPSSKWRKDNNLRPINNDYDLYSTGKDGSTTPAIFELDSHDDVVLANNGKWIGIGKNY